jgi:squalene synthase HpnC
MRCFMWRRSITDYQAPDARQSLSFPSTAASEIKPFRLDCGVIPTMRVMSHAEPKADAARPWHGVAHYENFPVASWLVPARSRPAITALYRFARYADDVADEGEVAPVERLTELAALDRALIDVTSAHPMVSPLRPYLRDQPAALADCQALLSAFRQDVTVHRHADFAALADYCARSAAPVGRLMLGLFGCRRPDLIGLSDAICTALQLINFVQDMAIDWQRGRLYIPLDELLAAGLTEDEIDQALRQRCASPALRQLIESQTRRCAALLESGAALVRLVPWRLGLELRGVMAGGRRIIELLARTGYDPFAHRPALRSADTPALLRLAISRPRL